MPLNVSFNDDQLGLYEELKSKKMISQTFPDFVKSVFHQKIDVIRKSCVDLSHNNIEALTFEQTKKLSGVKQ